MGRETKSSRFGDLPVHARDGVPDRLDLGASLPVTHREDKHDRTPFLDTSKVLISIYNMMAVARLMEDPWRREYHNAIDTAKQSLLASPLITLPYRSLR